MPHAFYFPPLLHPQFLALDIRPVHAGRSPWPRGQGGAPVPAGEASGRRRASWRAARLASAEAAAEEPTRFEVPFDGANIVWRVRRGREHSPPPPLAGAGAGRRETTAQQQGQAPDQGLGQEPEGSTLWVCVEEVAMCKDVEGCDAQVAPGEESGGVNSEGLQPA